jgi:hypothetical protein
MTVSGAVKYITVARSVDEYMVRHVVLDPFQTGYGLSVPRDRSGRTLHIAAPLLILETEESLDDQGRITIEKYNPIFGGWRCTYIGRPLKKRVDEGLIVLLLNKNFSRPEGYSLYEGLVLLAGSGDEWERVGYIGIQQF